MKSNRSTFIVTGIILMALIALAAITWGNYRFIHQNPEKSDFISRWAGARIFITQGVSPYSSQASREMQELAYGWEDGPGVDDLQYMYPFYAVFIYAPFALIGDLEWARAVWMTALEVGVLLIGVVGLYLSRWKIPKLLSVVLIVFAVTWFYSVQAVMDGNVAIFCVLAISACLLAIRYDMDVLAGFLLAIASIKPQMVILFILFVLIWAVSHRRWLIIWSFFGSVLLLFALAILLLPDWIMQYLRQILPYIKDFQFTTPGSIFSDTLPGIGRQMGWALTGIMVLLLFLEWRAALGKDFHWFLWTANLTLVVTILVGIPSSIFNFVVLLPVLIFVLVTVGGRWGRSGRVLMIMSMVILWISFWGIYLYNRSNGIPLTDQHILYLVLPLLAIIGLYWVRWWSIQKQRLPLQEIADRLVD